MIDNQFKTDNLIPLHVASKEMRRRILGRITSFFQECSLIWGHENTLIIHALDIIGESPKRIQVFGYNLKNCLLQEIPPIELDGLDELNLIVTRNGSALLKNEYVLTIKYDHLHIRKSDLNKWNSDQDNKKALIFSD